MKKFLTFVFLTFFDVMAYAQDAEISFKTEETDYGNIKQGADDVRVFESTNTGRAPLVITNIASSYDCTVPSWTNQSAAPGTKGKVEVRYDTNRVDPIGKTITVTSNTKTNPVKGLRIRGSVQ